jgi:RimJ/RimL family protein N-acetyltransferase
MYVHSSREAQTSQGGLRFREAVEQSHAFEISEVSVAPIHTHRLVLRPYEPRDREAFCPLVRDDELMRGLGGALNFESALLPRARDTRASPAHPAERQAPCLRRRAGARSAHG